MTLILSQGFSIIHLKLTHFNEVDGWANLVVVLQLSVYVYLSDYLEYFAHMERLSLLIKDCKF